MVTAGLRLYHPLLRHSNVRIGGLVGSFGRFKKINTVNLRGRICSLLKYTYLFMCFFTWVTCKLCFRFGRTLLGPCVQIHEFYLSVPRFIYGLIKSRLWCPTADKALRIKCSTCNYNSLFAAQTDYNQSAVILHLSVLLLLSFVYRVIFRC